jgi:hypothetical protein
MGCRVGVGKDGLSEILVEDPIDPIAEAPQQLHVSSWFEGRRALNWRGISPSYGRSIASARVECPSLRESHALAGCLYGFGTPDATSEVCLTF